ncbi:MAG: hypothetical protein ACTSXP_01620, partial [Promethearchaeota archaeon]
MSEILSKDPDLERWRGYKKIYDILSGHAKERWQCGYNVLQMFLKEYINLDVPLYTLQLYLRKKAHEYKKREGTIANLTPEQNLKFGEFTQLEDMAAYVFDIKPFSDEFNECMYYPALMMVLVGGTKRMTVEELFSNEGGKYIHSESECKDARRIHLACTIEESKYKKFKVGEKEYTGGQIFAKDYEGKGYILKGKEFDELRSRIAVESCKDVQVKVGGLMTSVSQLFGYEFDKKIYEEDRLNYAKIFYKKIKNYFENVGSRAGIPVVFNAMIYLIVDATLEPEPSVYILDPHDMQFQGENFKEKKKRVPMQYILGSPTGATLFFPPNREDIKKRLKEELCDPGLLDEARLRFCHLMELALFNKETYLKQLIQKRISKPQPEMMEFFRIIEDYSQCVYDNAVLEEIYNMFNDMKNNLESIINYVQNLGFSFDLLADELAHHFSEISEEEHLDNLKKLFRMKTVFISLPSFLKDLTIRPIIPKDEKLWQSCIKIGQYIDIKRINAGLGPTARNPFKQSELNFYTYIFRGLLYLFNSQDRYSHVEIVDEFLGGKQSFEKYYILAAIGEGLIKGSHFRNFVWVSIVERSFKELAEKIHKVLHGSVFLDMSIDRFLSLMQKGELKISEEHLDDIADAYNEACNYLVMPFEAILFFIDRLKNRMKETNIIKRQILVAISGNINSHPDLKEKIKNKIKVDFAPRKFNFSTTREKLMTFASEIHPIFVKDVFKRNLIYEIAEGTFFKNPENAESWPKLVDLIDRLRREFNCNMDSLQELISLNIGNVKMIDNLNALYEFNNLFKLVGQKETEFASKINAVY